ncbi:unnamed protein product [Acanthoscelides obtectus]|uniref:Retroviral polymerase SH3-like domain-containing protein n=1 Tax=Acanthoscelides obtectus TaxID=200917 RepID=A0A9P0MGD9_ACAOB|nr:unnamed protein product [Acanthoscelides obtectus]CAK1642266.1 hypothetical protein AOBTE_LOCUS12934 [Acanthoscelides obtectus]
MNILVGFSETVKGYRVYYPITNIITIKRDIIVMEEKKVSSEKIEEDTAEWIQNDVEIEDHESPTIKDGRDSVGEPSVNESLHDSDSAYICIY